MVSGNRVGSDPYWGYTVFLVPGCFRTISDFRASGGPLSVSGAVEGGVLGDDPRISDPYILDSPAMLLSAPNSTPVSYSLGNAAAPYNIESAASSAYGIGSAALTPHFCIEFFLLNQFTNSSTSVAILSCGHDVGTSRVVNWEIRLFNNVLTMYFYNADMSVTYVGGSVTLADVDSDSSHTHAYVRVTENFISCAQYINRGGDYTHLTYTPIDATARLAATPSALDTIRIAGYGSSVAFPASGIFSGVLAEVRVTIGANRGYAPDDWYMWHLDILYPIAIPGVLITDVNYTYNKLLILGDTPTPSDLMGSALTVVGSVSSGSNPEQDVPNGFAGNAIRLASIESGSTMFGYGDGVNNAPYNLETVAVNKYGIGPPSVTPAFCIEFQIANLGVTATGSQSVLSCGHDVEGERKCNWEIRVDRWVCTLFFFNADYTLRWAALNFNIGDIASNAEGVYVRITESWVYVVSSVNDYVIVDESASLGWGARGSAAINALDTLRIGGYGRTGWDIYPDVFNGFLSGIRITIGSNRGLDVLPQVSYNMATAASKMRVEGGSRQGPRMLANIGRSKGALLHSQQSSISTGFQVGRSLAGNIGGRAIEYLNPVVESQIIQGTNIYGAVHPLSFYGDKATGVISRQKWVSVAAAQAATSFVYTWLGVPSTAVLGVLVETNTGAFVRLVRGGTLDGAVIDVAVTGSGWGYAGSNSSYMVESAPILLGTIPWLPLAILSEPGVVVEGVVFGATVCAGVVYPLPPVVLGVNFSTPCTKVHIMDLYVSVFGVGVNTPESYGVLLEPFIHIESFGISFFDVQAHPATPNEFVEGRIWQDTPIHAHLTEHRIKVKGSARRYALVVTPTDVAISGDLVEKPPRLRRAKLVRGLLLGSHCVVQNKYKVRGHAINARPFRIDLVWSLDTASGFMVCEELPARSIYITDLSPQMLCVSRTGFILCGIISDLDPDVEGRSNAKFSG